MQTMIIPLRSMGMNWLYGEEGEQRTGSLNKIAIQGTHQMAADKEAISVSRVYSHYSTCKTALNLSLTTRYLAILFFQDWLGQTNKPFKKHINTNSSQLY